VLRLHESLAVDLVVDDAHEEGAREHMAARVQRAPGQRRHQHGLVLVQQQQVPHLRSQECVTQAQPEGVEAAGMQQQRNSRCPGWRAPAGRHCRSGSCPASSRKSWRLCAPVLLTRSARSHARTGRCPAPNQGTAAGCLARCLRPPGTCSPGWRPAACAHTMRSSTAATCLEGRACLPRAAGHTMMMFSLGQ
jgi:hypothetical protein